MHLDQFLADFALMMIVASIITLIFRRLGISIILGYILAGFLISPNFALLPTVIEMDSIQTWSNIGIVFLLFGLGLEFSFHKLASVGMNAIITVITLLCGMSFIGMATGKLLGWTTMDSIFLGAMISISSTMVILKSYEEYKLKKERFATLVLGVLLLEDIAGIFMIIILTTVSVSKNISGASLANKLMIMILSLVIWIVVGIFFIPSMLNRVKNLLNKEMLLIISIAICLGMVAIGTWIGFSEALGAFIAGSILAGTIRGEEIEHLIEPIKNLFGAVFFISVGMMIQPKVLVEQVVPVIVISIVIIVFQIFFATSGILLSGRSLKTAVYGGTSMMQIGEFSFIIGALGNSLGVIGNQLFPIIVCVAVITIALTPFFIKHSEKIYVTINKIIPIRVQKFINNYTSERSQVKDKTNDWKRFLKRYMIRVLVGTAALFTIFEIAMKIGLPFAFSHQSIVVKITICLCTVLIMIPFIVLMHSGRRQDIFKKLWIKRKANRLPLITLGMIKDFISAFFVMMVCRRFLGLPHVLLMAFAVIFVILITRTDFMNDTSIRAEIRFISNLNEKVLTAKRKEQQKCDDTTWLSNKLFVFKYKRKKEMETTKIKDMYDNRVFDILMAKLVRKNKTIVMPKSDDKIYGGDELHVLSTRDHLEAYIYYLKQKGVIDEDNTDSNIITLKEYFDEQMRSTIPAREQILPAVFPVEKDDTYDGKTLKTCGFRERYNGYIMCIVRGNYPIINPRPDEKMMAGDLLWTIGTEATVDKLIKDDMI